MADSPQHLKKRLKSVASINKITKAMELVAATKMRRSQEIALASRPYAFAALDLLATVINLKAPLPLLLQQRKIKKVLFILVASDKGMAGAFNSSLFRKFEKHIAESKEHYASEEKLFLAVGEKAFQYLSKKGYSVLEKFTNVGDYAAKEQVQPLADFVIDGYMAEKFDRVVIFSTHFQSALKQEALVRRVLPVDFDHIRNIIEGITPTTGKFAELIKDHNLDFAKEKKTHEYVIEPSSQMVLEDLSKHLLFMQIYHVILEANASEHSARRMAMKTASDNANDLGEDLHVQYNKVRQGLITKEIIEITAGAEALS